MANRDRSFNNFEDFERAELRALETLGTSVDDLIDTLFATESEEVTSVRRSPWDDDIG